MSNSPTANAQACLALLLDGPMQSWGYASRFTRRTTALHPTKSGIVGLLAAALGIDKNAPDEAAHIARLAALNCTVITLPKQRGHEELNTLLLADYHTIGGGYDAKADWMKKPRAASGATLETVLSERHYLLDARFGVLLQGEQEWLAHIATKLRDPTWGVWLGRKCCIPSSPLLVGLHPDQHTAWQALLKVANRDPSSPLSAFDHVVEKAPIDEVGAKVAPQWLDDAPVAFGAPIGQRHVPRQIWQVKRKRK